PSRPAPLPYTTLFRSVDVTLLCRGKHLEAIRSRGLSLSTPGETFCVEVKASDVPQSPVDLIIQAVKFYDLAPSTREMLPLVGPRSESTRLNSSHQIIS